ncbi:mitotic interactor and substrate of PLK1 [Neofelis nebulosa]|uniref:mitotic interactor and substrate of PLK1 n=1 Tax=Neofelis nebulosa TaxID=61452 RepID=UPI00272AB7CA|nr:mitotic interactor and substrate of PLK1 [Neofelis nebulosa]XP_058584618.1 mitotic interactor and substrate of PLK1 [Neofelis nebulosa]XP_058584619.1 mitotic interactor and substrate of PLK1 [Neofelis nebulosa]XP_058584620.1 mitotic interactor and substrate of PLK1 [Neofelis nebulosa]
MDRVTRYPIFGIPHSPRVGGLGLEEGTGYTFELVDAGPAASGWDQNKPRALPADREAGPNAAGPKASRSPCAFLDRPAPWGLGREGDKKEEAKACRRHPRDAQPTRPRSLEREHRAVIQGQALRKGSTVATLQGRPAHGDPGSPGQAQSGPPEEHVVDREQINFLVARRQFLSLEQAGAAVPQNLPARAAPACAPPAVGQASTASSGLPPANGCAVPPKPQGRDAVSGENGGAGGLPAAPGARAVGGRGSRSRVGSPEPPGETPIEREIRRAQEREADLREQRGLRQAASQQEMVEIPTRPLLTKVSLASAPRRDRGRPSLYVQRDLVQETQREEDHRREGLKLGEPSTPARAALGPQPGLRKALSSDSILGLAPEDGPARPAPAVRKEDRGIPADALQPPLRPGSPRLACPALHASGRPGGLSAAEAEAVGSPQATGSPWHLLESSGKPAGAKPQCSKPREGPPPAKRGVIRQEHFCLRPLRFRVPDGPLQAAAPHVPGWEGRGILASTLQRSQSSELLEKEVESVLQREREVAEERRQALFPEVFSPPPNDDDDDDDDEPDGSRSSSAASGVMGSYSVSESHFFTPIHLSGVAGAPKQKKRKEPRYASLSASDHINSEVLEATRVTRHTNAKARCWEARIYANEGKG